MLRDDNDEITLLEDSVATNTDAHNVFYIDDMRQYNYLRIKNGRLHVFLPFINAALFPDSDLDASIGGDNTCRALTAWQDFFGGQNQANSGEHKASALQELNNFKARLALYLSTNLSSSEQITLAQQLLSDVYIYIAAVMMASEQSGYDETIWNLVSESDNFFTFLLHPKITDSVIHTKKHTFEMVRNESSPFFTTFVSQFTSERRKELKEQNKSTSKTLTTNGLIAELQTRAAAQTSVLVGYEDIKQFIISDLNAREAIIKNKEGINQYQTAFSADMFKFTQIANITNENNLPEQTVFRNTTDLNPDDVGDRDAVIASMLYSADERILESLEKASHFEKVLHDSTNGKSNTTYPFNLYILAQIFLMVANTYCCAKGVVEKNKNFGEILETNKKLSSEFWRALYNALENGSSVEEALIAFLNVNRGKFLLKNIDEADGKKIAATFNEVYTMLKDAPHHDDGAIGYFNNDSGNAYFVNGMMCFDFATFLRKKGMLNGNELLTWDAHKEEAQEEKKQGEKKAEEKTLKQKIVPNNQKRIPLHFTEALLKSLDIVGKKTLLNFVLSSTDNEKLWLNLLPIKTWQEFLCEEMVQFDQCRAILKKCNGKMKEAVSSVLFEDREDLRQSFLSADALTAWAIILCDKVSDHKIATIFENICDSGNLSPMAIKNQVLGIFNGLSKTPEKKQKVLTHVISSTNKKVQSNLTLCANHCFSGFVDTFLVWLRAQNKINDVDCLTRMLADKHFNKELKEALLKTNEFNEIFTCHGHDDQKSINTNKKLTLFLCLPENKQQALLENLVVVNGLLREKDENIFFWDTSDESQLSSCVKFCDQNDLSPDGLFNWLNKLDVTSKERICSEFRLPFISPDRHLFAMRDAYFLRSLRSLRSQCVQPLCAWLISVASESNKPLTVHELDYLFGDNWLPNVKAVVKTSDDVANMLFKKANLANDDMNSNRHDKYGIALTSFNDADERNVIEQFSKDYSITSFILKRMIASSTFLSAKSSAYNEIDKFLRPNLSISALNFLIDFLPQVPLLLENYLERDHLSHFTLIIREVLDLLASLFFLIALPLRSLESLIRQVFCPVVGIIYMAYYHCQHFIQQLANCFQSMEDLGILLPLISSDPLSPISSLPKPALIKGFLDYQIVKFVLFITGQNELADKLKIKWETRNPKPVSGVNQNRFFQLSPPAVVPFLVPFPQFPGFYLW